MRILLLEDSPVDARLFTACAKRASFDGSAVRVVSTLSDACVLVEEAKFDVAFLDLGLPDADGLQSLHAVRKACPRLPIVVLTSRTEEALALEALRSGAQDYLLKDLLKPEQLRRVIKFAIERKQGEEAEGIRQRERSEAQRLEAIGRLAAGIAHEINTPMQYIGDNLEFIKQSIDAIAPVLASLQGALSEFDRRHDLQGLAEVARGVDVPYLLEELPAAVAQSLEGVERVTGIVRAMKEFSHPGTKEMRHVELWRAVESTLTVCRNEWKYIADAEVDIPQDLPALPCYPGDLNQVFLNLVVNAAHAIGDKYGSDSGKKGVIRISARQDGGSIVIRVSDDGGGIPAEARSKIFEPFFTTKEVGKGTGQGLAFVHKVIVEGHAGSVTFETESGVGTTFVLTLPLGEESPQRSAEMEEARP